MKRFFAILMVLTTLLSLGACGAKEEPAPTPAPTAEPAPAPTPEPTPTPTPAPTEPPYELGIARARYGEAIYAILELGTEVTVIGKYSDYYVIDGEEVDLLIDERFLRLEGEEPFEPWTGYAMGSTKVYANGYMDGEVIAELGTNAEVQVIDGKADWLRIQWSDGEGYARLEEISDHKLVARGKKGGGGPQDGTDVSLGGLASFIVKEKPGIMQLSAYVGPEMEPVANVKALTLTHDTRAYLFLTERGDELKVTKVDEEVCEIYVNGFYAEVPRWLVHLEGDEEYEAWDGFAKGEDMYEEYQLRHVLAELNTNDELRVIDELPTCYVVEFDGQTGYVELEQVSEHRIVARAGGGGGGGGSSGGGGWTPPKL